MVSDTIRFTANDKDVSLALEMTTRESDVSQSLAAPDPYPPVTISQTSYHTLF